MFKKKELETVYDLLIKKELSQANNLLINLRQFGVLHPEYLFLMSLFLMETGRTYLAIYSLLLSLKVDNTPEVMKKNNFEGTLIDQNNEDDQLAFNKTSTCFEIQNKTASPSLYQKYLDQPCSNIKK